MEKSLQKNEGNVQQAPTNVNVYTGCARTAP